MFKKTDLQVKAIDLVGTTKAKYYMWFGGSRSGKTFLNVYIVITRALKYPNSRHLIARKTLRSIRSSIIQDTIPKVIDLCFPQLKGHYKLNQSNWYMEFPNGSTIWFGGIGNVDEAEKILGNEYCTIFLNETSELFYRAVLKVRTRLAQKIPGCRNYMLHDCNPPSRSHWSYKEFIENVSPLDPDQKLNQDDYKTMLLNPGDNVENIDEEYIKTLEAMPERERNRFLLGLWQEEVEGAVLGTELALAEQEQRIGDFPHDPKYPVYTAWDIGHTDSTAIWCFQIMDGWINVINYYENCLEGLPHYIRWLEGKTETLGYKYETDFYPHDGGNTEWSMGKTRKAIAITEHNRSVFVLPRTGKQDMISNARTLLARIRFNKSTTKFGLHVLRNFRYEFDEKYAILKDKEPLHDENSHGGYSFLYLCLAYFKKKEEIVYRTRDEQQAIDIEKQKETIDSILKFSNKIILDDKL